MSHLHEHHEHHEHHDEFCCHEEHLHDTASLPDVSTATFVSPLHIYQLENLVCANCAAKMEKKIQELPQVESATITFATRQLRIHADNPDKLLIQLQEICASIEPDVMIIPAKQQNPHPPHEHTTHKQGKEWNELIGILLGVLFLIAGLCTLTPLPPLSLAFFLIAYLILGFDILLTAAKNLLKGNIFDENFLMSIATIGAFAIREYPEAVGVMLFYRIGEWFEHRAVEKSRSQIMEALDLRPETVQKKQGNEVVTIPATQAVVEDILLIRPGDRIPLDGIVIDGESQLDTSPVTGEPVPVCIIPGSHILSGCINRHGAIQMKVTKPLSESMVTRILNSVENAAASKPHIDRFITRFSRVYTPFVVILALCTAIIPSLIGGDWNRWIYAALNFLVISCPCALVLSVPLAYFSGIGAGSKQGILFKGGASLEAMKKVKAVVMDKTGTVTKGNFVVQKIIPLASDMTESGLLALAASCEAASTHPIALSISNAALEKKLMLEKADSLKEISGQGVEMHTGSHIILCGNRKLMENWKIELSAYTPSGYGSEVLLARDGILIGWLIISDTLKEDAAASIASLKKLGLYTAMLTGDTTENALKVANKTGIDSTFAKLLPDEKVEKLAHIRAEHGTVMFVGDGINDAPVLAGADVGAAMGSGADAAIEVADVVFMNSGMQSIPKALQIARVTGRIAAQNVIFALAVKAIIMVLALFGIASMWLAVFADTGVAMLCILNAIRLLH